MTQQQHQQQVQRGYLLSVEAMALLQEFLSTLSGEGLSWKKLNPPMQVLINAPELDLTAKKEPAAGKKAAATDAPPNGAGKPAKSEKPEKAA